jgi:hypothetical protein
VEGSCFGPTVADGDLDQQVFRGHLGVFDEDVEVAVAVEDAGVDELVFELIPRAPAIRPH